MNKKTLKTVIYNILKQKHEGLAAYYNEYRNETQGLKGYKVFQIFEEDFNFWMEELKLYPINEEKLIDIVYDFNHDLITGNYIDSFEKNILPLLLEHWKFDNEG